MIKIPAQFNNSITKADGSASLRFTTGLEITEDDNTEFFRHRGLDGWLIFAEDDLQEVEIPKVDADPDKKSPSQRMRSALWVRYKEEKGRKPSDDEFNSFYLKWMNREINKLLDF